MSTVIIVRIQSPTHGTKRIQTRATERLDEFFSKVRKEFGLDSSGWLVYQDRERTRPIKSSRSKTLNSIKVRHGDMLYLHPSSSEHSNMETTDSASVGESSHTQLSRPGSALSTVSVTEDPVDLELSKMDGRIRRERDEQYCRHGPHGKCLHCVPLEPFDEKYLNSLDPPIKFLSFHSHIRKLLSGVDKGKFVNLENLSCKIKPGCKEHPPWPAGICTKCQPNAVTLNRQKFRHVDYIMFENPQLMERYLNYWRKTGCQRIGFMYGVYEHHKDMPLGIKATVAAIYEPPQVSSKNSVELLEDPNEVVVQEIARKLGLQKVGWIFTDLVAQDLQKGTVKHFRGNMDSHFLSAEECIMAAVLQNNHPNPCKYSADGHYGSKFATVVVSGDKDNQIHFEGYQVSDQCMALVRDDCLIPTRDAPELGYVKESTNDQYVPDVFYKFKDKYGNEVTQLARPLPVEYLLIDMPAAFPVDSQYTFSYNSDTCFPVENRDALGEIQDFNALTTYMNQFPKEKFLEAVSDFHLLIYLAMCDVMPLRDHMDMLLEAVKTKSVEAAHHWSKCEQWATLEQLMHHSVPSPTPAASSNQFVGPNASPLPPIGSSTSLWTCSHCTYINQPAHQNCDMCGLPK